MTAPPSRLDPIALATEAYRRLWRARDHALLLGLPLLILGIGWNLLFGDELAALSTLGADGAMPTPKQLMAQQVAILRLLAILILPALLLYAILIGNLARLLLIGPGTTRPLLGLALDARLLAVVWRFVQSVLATWLLSILLSIPLQFLLVMLGAAGGMGFAVGLLAMAAVALVALAVWLRLSLAAFATALDRPMRLLEAWRASAGNGFALLGTFLAVNLPVLAASVILGALLDAFAPTVPLTALLLLNLVALAGSLASIAVVALAAERLLGSSQIRGATVNR
jgi:hypothetical protein